MTGEGLLDRVPATSDVPLDDTAHLLSALQHREQNVIVECENRDADEKDFYIGQILSVDVRSLSFANFDALGRWDERPHTIPIETITKVQFDTPYVRTFSKYVEGPCQDLRLASGRRRVAQRTRREEVHLSQAGN
jgi:hypothetical protein